MVNYTLKGIICRMIYYICTRKGIIMEYTIIADFVKEMRRQFGLTQVDLAWIWPISQELVYALFVIWNKVSRLCVWIR